MLNYLDVLFYYYILPIWSKLSGLVAHVYIPVFLRPIIIPWYAWKTQSRTYEAVKTTKEFNNIYEFFTREIKQRPVDHVAEIVSPVDCTILAAGSLKEKNWQFEQIKGITYQMEELLGATPEEAAELKKKNLYYMSIHLPASECHRFRSPTEWSVERRTHIPGTMYRLDASNMFHNPKVLHNERVVLEGKWKHGKFFFVAVGADKVGSIVLNFDPNLHTNVIGESFRKEEKEEYFRVVEYDAFKYRTRIREFGQDQVQLQRADEFGHFQGGSAFAIVFEHPSPVPCFFVTPPQYILYGNPVWNWEHGQARHPRQK